MGTYDAPEKVYDIVKAAPEPFCGMMKRIIEMRIAVPELPMEEAFAACLKEDDMELDEAQLHFYEYDVCVGCLYQGLFPESGTR